MNPLGCLSLLFNPIIGIFLMSDDDDLKPIYNLMMRTCCQPCADQPQCRGGLACLMTWIIINVISAVMSLFNGVWFEVFHKVNELTAGTISNNDMLATAIWLLATLAAFL